MLPERLVLYINKTLKKYKIQIKYVLAGSGYKQI